MQDISILHLCEGRYMGTFYAQFFCKSKIVRPIINFKKLKREECEKIIIICYLCSLERKEFSEIITNPQAI